MTAAAAPVSTANLIGSALVAETLRQEMARDPSIVLLGEDIGALGGVFGATRGLLAEYGPDRVLETPISETAFLGTAIGLAQSGYRPVVELMFVDFIGVCFDQVLNQMAKHRYMSGGAQPVPLVLRTAVGCIGAAAQHSQVLSATFAHIPGLKVVFPATLGDLQAGLLAAIRDDDPVIFLEHKRLLKSRPPHLAWTEPDDAAAEALPPGRLRVLREGADVVIVSAGYTVQESLRAADLLAEDGIEARVVDLRWLVPLDRAGLAEVASGSRALLVVDEDYAAYGMCGEVIACVAEALGPEAPRMARHAPRVPVPASRPLEEQVVPSPESIARAARELVA